MLELVDKTDSKSVARKGVRVRVPFPPPKRIRLKNIYFINVKAHIKIAVTHKILIKILTPNKYFLISMVLTFFPTPNLMTK